MRRTTLLTMGTRAICMCMQINKLTQDQVGVKKAVCRQINARLFAQGNNLTASRQFRETSEASRMAYSDD